MNVYFCLSELSTTKIVTWKCHVDESTEGRHITILGIYRLKALGPDIKLPDNVIIGVDGPF